MEAIKAIHLNSGAATFYYERGRAWLDQDAYEHAIADFDEAIRQEPQYGEAYLALAWLLATCPNERFRNGKRAVALGRQALALNCQSPSITEILAAAHSEAGNFDEAVAWRIRSLREW
jgi:tetratricopeptide (TPR) repeat protein